ncbi:NAD-dependent epimerase/dehydratase family protein [Streptosporangium fragile]|uniref:NAD-dependent epimerase/dehydratase family protein n=1 Tax=Streptosporangium fragile TaxID=46186 RepID=A0ABN3VQC3_9ACTN
MTGAAGFIGRMLTRTLIEAGENVVGIDRIPQPARPGLTVLTADLLDDDGLVRAALDGADVVYHLAGCPGVRDRRPGVARRRHRDNVLAGARVLAAVPPSVPLLVASSSSVYGGARGGWPSRESDPPRPAGGYAESKTLLERLCAERIARGGLTTVVRPFTVAGEGQRPDMALSQWLAAAREGRPLRVLGSLDRTRDVTDVRQVARAMTDLVARGAQGTVNIGTGRGHSLRALAAAVAEALGAEVSFAVEPASPVEPGASLADTSRLRSLVGWTPETDLLDLVRRQAAASAPAAPGDRSGKVREPVAVGASAAGPVVGAGPAGPGLRAAVRGAAVLSSLAEAT